MYDSVRLALLALVDPAFTASHPSVPLVYDNTPFDRNSPPDIYVEVDVRFNDARRIGVSNRSPIRDTGSVGFTVSVRENLGSKVAQDILWEIRELLRDKWSGSVEFHLPQNLPGPTVKGWYRPLLDAPFTLTTIPAP